MLKQILVFVFLSGMLPVGTFGVHRTEITFDQLMSDVQPSSIVLNKFFEKQPVSTKAEPFSGELFFKEFTMSSEPFPIHDEDENGMPDLVYGKNVQLFPAVKIEYFTDPSATYFIPKNRNPVKIVSGDSYWYVLFSVGRAWKENTDKGMSRVLIPFALMHPIDGDTRNGLITFLYDGKKVSNYQMQIVRQTSLWTIGNFVSWGKGELEVTRTKISKYESIYKRFRKERSKSVRILPWSTLERLYPGKTDKFEGPIPPEKVVANGLYCEDCFLGKSAFFMKSCNTKYGELPLCEESRFGMWSVGKSLMTATAYFSLADKINPGALANKKLIEVFSDYVHLVPPVKKGLTGWDSVTLDDAMNMATGIGEGSHKATTFSDGYEYHGDDDPNHPNYPYGPHFIAAERIYNAWSTSFSLNQKLTRVFSDSKYYPWGPGEVARYRDRDYFLAGSAMSRILQKDLKSEDLWSYVQNTVLNKIGLNEIPVGRTIESGNSLGTPTWAWGIYPTLGEAIKIAKLIQNHGSYGDQQLFNRAFTRDSLMAGNSGNALETGYKTGSDKILYYRSFWQLPFRNEKNCLSYVPTMIGWGGNKIALFSNKMIGLQVADHYPEADNENHEIISMGIVANKIRPFHCR